MRTAEPPPRGLRLGQRLQLKAEPRPNHPGTAVAPRVRGPHVPKRLGGWPEPRGLQSALHGPGHHCWRASQALSTADPARSAPGRLGSRSSCQCH